MRKINEIIIHCSATRPEWMAGATVDAKVSEIRTWHVRDRKWSDIGYHFIIDRNGFVAKGRPVTRTGAHVKGHNTGTIGVCLIGGHGSTALDAFPDNFTPAQDKALRAMLDDMKSIYGPVLITGHNEYAAKACPGFSVPEWLGTSVKQEQVGGFASIISKLFALLFERFSK